MSRLTIGMLATALAIASPLATALAESAATGATLPVHKAPEHAHAYFITPKDGATVGRKLTVRFGLSGMGVAPSGVDRPKTGHFHLLIDVDTLPPAGLPIPSDAHHRHFGGGQIETVLNLSPGTHTLQIEMGDARHVPFDPPVLSRKITIRVE